VGLDATGAIETRSLLRSLCKELGKTIVFTTHNIVEAEKLCERIAVMSNGRVVAVDTPLKLSERRKRFRGVEVRASDTQEDILKILEGIEGVTRVVRVEREEDYTVVQLEVRDEKEALAEIPEVLNARGVRLIGIQVALPTLEEVFIDLTSEKRNEPS